jgi:hypothetical protein
MNKPYKWRRNDAGGVTLMLWQPPRTHLRFDGTQWTTLGNYNACADVYKAKQGNRWVARWLAKEGTGANWRQGSTLTLTLREAMRLAQFMVGMQDGL